MGFANMFNGRLLFVFKELLNNVQKYHFYLRDISF